MYTDPTNAVAELFEADCWEMRFEQEMTHRQIARRKGVGVDVVRRAIERYHRRRFGTNPPSKRFGRFADGELRQSRAYRLINAGTVTADMPADEVKKLSGYANWTQLCLAARRYRAQTGRARARSAWGELSVRRARGRARLVLSTNALRAAAWNPAELVYWRIEDGRIRLARIDPDEHDAGSLAFRSQGSEGVVRVVLVTNKTTRVQLALTLESPILRLKWRPGETVRWSLVNETNGTMILLERVPATTSNPTPEPGV